ncbi:hypothetical protein GOV03_04550 [Candidatus Woesearchaeota archaeon]|nr:hypothetical protein [Candidatus Woesearchaeota archaeon]
MKFKSFMLGICFGAATIGLGLTYIGGTLAEPKHSYAAGDLNQDGIPDMVIEQVSGYKTPMYGVPVGKGILYVTASEIKKRSTNFEHPKFDYQGMEEFLNEDMLF